MTGNKSRCATITVPLTDCCKGQKIEILLGMLGDDPVGKLIANVQD